MTKKYLLVNENGSDNIGDHAINEGLKSLLDDKGCSFESAHFSAKKTTEKVKNSTEQVDRSFTSNIKRWLLSIKPLFHLLWLLKNKNTIKVQLNGDYDGVIIGGGQLILSGFTFPVAMFAWVKYAKKMGLPVYIIGVGCGERFLASEIKLYQKALSQCDKIFVREQASIVKVKKFFDVDAEYCPDLAFGLTSKQLITERSGIVVGMTDYAVYSRYQKEVTTEGFLSYERYLDGWCDSVIKLLRDNAEPIILASTTNKDAECNRALYSLLKDNLNNPITLIDGVKSLDEYRNILAGSRLIFSGRMHSLILGKVESCDFEPWIISAKIIGFLENYKNRNIVEVRTELDYKLRTL